jgi:hypothetical protein
LRKHDSESKRSKKSRQKNMKKKENKNARAAIEEGAVEEQVLPRRERGIFFLEVSLVSPRGNISVRVSVCSLCTSVFFEM